MVCLRIIPLCKFEVAPGRIAPPANRVTFYAHAWNQHLRRRPLQTLAWVCCSLCALLCVPVAALSADACSVNPGIAPPAPGSKPSLTADTALLEQNGLARAVGHVRLVRGVQALQAPRLVYDRKSTRVTAPDGLHYYRPGIQLKAGQASVAVDQQTGTLEDVHFGLSANGGHGQAHKVQLKGAKHASLFGANYTTCPTTGIPAWQLSAGEIDLNRESGRGVAHNAVMRIHGWPVFWTPYINFPIDNKRHTGFLIPTLGNSSRSGFELATPYYLNIAPGLDATLTPRVLTRRGLQLGGQLRYLNAHNKGQLVGEFLPVDRRHDHDNRSLIQIQHTGRLGRHFGVEVNYSHVSDDDYFDDLGSGLSSTSHSQLEQRIVLGFAATGIRLAVLAQGFQNLDDNPLSSLNLDAYNRLPQVTLSVLSPTAPWRIGLDASMTSFERRSSINGRRYNLRPRVIWRTDHGGWYFKSQAAYRLTYYRLDHLPPGADNSIQRHLPSFSAELGLRFQRVLGNGWVQTLEPRLHYLYMGYDNQLAIPLFDTGRTDLDFNRLFSRNRFLGADRIGDANQLTLGVTSRFLEPNSGRTVLKVDLGRVFGFRDLRVHLPGRALVGYGNRDSDIVTHLVYSPAPAFHGALTLQYDPHDNQLNRSLLRLGYQGDHGKNVEISYRRYRDFRPAPPANTHPETLEQAGVFLQWPVTSGIRFIGRWDYSIQAHRGVNALAGVAYHASCCWAVRVAWNRHIRHESKSTHPARYDSAVMLQIELTGLGRFGDRINSALRHDIVDNSFGINRLEFR